MRQGGLSPLGVCVSLSVCVTHIRYEDGKQTQVGDGDTELSRLPGPAGGHEKRERSPERLHNLLGFELFGHKIKNTHTHVRVNTQRELKFA